MVRPERVRVSMEPPTGDVATVPRQGRRPDLPGPGGAAVARRPDGSTDRRPRRPRTGPAAAAPRRRRARQPGPPTPRWCCRPPTSPPPRTSKRCSTTRSRVRPSTPSPLSTDASTTERHHAPWPQEIDPRILASTRVQPPPLHRRRRRRGGRAGPRAVLPRRVWQVGQLERFERTWHAVRRRLAGHRQAAHLQLAAVHGRRFRRGVPDRDRHARSTTKRTSTTTRSGSPRSRSRCRASRTSAPTWWCRPSSWPPGSTAWAGSTRSAKADVPNKKNMRPDLLDANADPGRKFSAPYMSGMVGLAYNRAATGRDITKIDDLWDPAFKGKVSLFVRHPGRPGHDHALAGQLDRRPDDGDRAEGRRPDQGQKDKGQIRRFTGNDYADDLAAGNVVIAQAYSGDVVQLQTDNPGPAVRRPGVRRHDVRRHHGHPVHHAEPERPPRSGSTTSTTGPTTPSWSRSSSTSRCCRT